MRHTKQTVRCPGCKGKGVSALEGVDPHGNAMTCRYCNGTGKIMKKVGK